MSAQLSLEQKKRLSNRNILLFVSGKFISLFGSSIYSFAIGLYILKLTGSGTSFAVALVCASVPRIIFGPIVGTLADRFDRKKIIILSEVLSGLLMLFMIGYSVLFGLPLLLLYISEVLISIFSTFFSVTASSSIPSMAGDKSIQKAGSLNQSASSLAGILGPIIAGILYGFLSIQMIILINACSFIVAAVIEAFILFDLYANHEKTVEKQEFFQSMKEGFLYLKDNGFLYSLIKASFWINFFFAGINVALPYLLVTELKFSSSSYGLVSAIVSVGALLTSLILSTRKEIRDKMKAIRLGLYGLAILTTAIGIPPMLEISHMTFNVSYYLVVLGAIGAIIMIVNIPIQVLIQRTTPSHYLGRIFGLVETIASAISPIGMVLFGIMLDHLPSFYIPILAGTALLFIAIFGMRGISAPTETKLAG